MPDDTARAAPAPNGPAPVPATTEAPVDRPRWNANTVLATVAVGAVLYMGQAIFVPLALAALLAFVLDPLVTALRRVGLPRAPAAVLVVLSTVVLMGATSVFVAGQVTQLAKDLPTYQTTVQTKLRALRHQLAASSGTFDATTRMLSAVGGELDAARRELARETRPVAPTRVVMATEPRDALQTVVDMVAPLLGPLGTAGAVLLFLVFVLIERHDMRDRLLRLTGADLHRSTDALGEAGERVSRYLGMQLLVNMGYGLPLALGLWLIGVPGAPLWGLLGALLRFVPYVGPWAAALFPLTLAFAVDPGWEMVLWTVALVVTLELIINNVIEPWLYGASTGLSALALVVSAMFWTLLWGPIGLILSTPLTVCLAVLGRHVTQLSWLDVLLGSEPVFDQPTRLYQRLLAGDVEEAIELCEQQARSEGLAACYSGIALPALALTERAHARNAHSGSQDHRDRVAAGMATLLRHLHADLPAADEGRDATKTPAAPRVLCLGARSHVDNLGAEMLAQTLAHGGIPARVSPLAAVDTDHLETLDLTGIEVVCLSAFGRTPHARVRHITRRLKRRLPGLRLLVGAWNASPPMAQAEASGPLGADAIDDTLAAMVQRVPAVLGQGGQVGQVDPTEPLPLPNPRASAAPGAHTHATPSRPPRGTMDPTRPSGRQDERGGLTDLDPAHGAAPA